MTETQTPPPPPPPSPNYVLFGLLGVIVALLVVVVVLLVSSGDEESVATTAAANPTVAASSSTSGSTVEATSASTTEAPATTAAATTLPPFQGDTGDEVAAGDFFGTFNFLENIRFQQRQGGFTRVVFDFEDGDIPWWSVGYATGPFVDPGDNPIAVDGDAYLQVVLSSTSFDLSGAEVRITYDGPDRIPANTNSVVEIVNVDDFEGSSTWIIGVDGMKPFAVGTLTNPPRVYIDIGD